MSYSGCRRADERPRTWRAWRPLFQILPAALSLALTSCGVFEAPDYVPGPRPTVARRVTRAEGVPEAQGPIAPATPEELIPFEVPAGYVASRVASAPLVVHPMFACFDDRGRLYVAGSSGRNRSPMELSESPDGVIRRLEDSDGDGLFDRSTVFADRLTYPQGVLWHDGAVYTASPPSLWRLEDGDGDGVADLRRELVTGFPFTGIADDLHGPTLGADGRLYWGVGRFPYEISKPSGPRIAEGDTPLIMRCRPDGEEIEVFGAAMGNPVEVAFTPEGEPFACGTFLSPESQGAGFRDAIIHSVYGGYYAIRGRRHTSETRTGDPLPPLVQLGVAAGSGLLRARGGAFGDDSRITLYPALFNMRSVPRCAVERDGATFRAHEAPFLTSSVPDFHPTDVLEDADGSLLVVDTGGWFRSCPTSQVEKPNRRGAIYRIRRESFEEPDDPWGNQLDWAGASPEALAGRLDDPRFAVRDRAVAALVQRGDAALAGLREVLDGGSTRERLHAVNVLTRIASATSKELIRDALDDEDERVRLAAINAAGLLRDGAAAGRAREMLATDRPAVRREAATTIGRLGVGGATPQLLQALGTSPDRFLEHALIYALIQLGDETATALGLGDANLAVRRGALIALDQMGDHALTLDMVSPLLDTADPVLRNEALYVTSRHREWAEPMAEILGRWIDHGAAAIDPAVLRRQLVAYSSAPSIQSLVLEAVDRQATPAATRILLLEVMSLVRLDEWPPSWLLTVRKALADRDEQVALHAVRVVRSNDRLAFEGPLLELARDRTRGRDLRVEALDAVVPRLKGLEAPLFAFLVEQLGRDELPLRRLTAARALGRAPLDTQQLLALGRTIRSTGALCLPHLLKAYERGQDPRAGNALLDALRQAPGFRSLTKEALQRALKGYPEEVRRRAEPLFGELEFPEEEKASRLAELTNLLGRGDPIQGREVFFGTRAACSTCHKVGGEGGRVGPDLALIHNSEPTRQLRIS
jgi:putative membrane-bound dehydrogenase-like protein